jgi:predicted small integral membrane protein
MIEKLEHIETPIDIVATDDPAPDVESSGFLPIQTNWFDRLFISVVIWVALSLFWFRFMEPLGLSIWISNVIVMAVAAIIITKG